LTDRVVEGSLNGLPIVPFWEVWGRKFKYFGWLSLVVPFWDGWFWIGEILATDTHRPTRTGRLEGKRIHRPDEISATEISLGRQRAQRALRKDLKKY
jgi:hypothetical protein